MKVRKAAQMVPICLSSERFFSDRKLSPKRCQRVDIDLENEDCLGDSEGNYIDDDVYGLSIKKESEELRQQELLIEEEVKHACPSIF